MNIDYRTEEDFFDIIKYFKTANYDQKVAYMKKNWGNIVSKTTIPYGNGCCSITIYFDETNKYRFDFDCKNIPLSTLEQHLPNYADALFCYGEERIVDQIPELVDFSICKNEPETEQNVSLKNDKIETETQNKSVNIDYNYLGLYNGVSISHKKTDKK